MIRSCFTSQEMLCIEILWVLYFSQGYFFILFFSFFLFLLVHGGLGVGVLGLGSSANQWQQGIWMSHNNCPVTIHVTVLLLSNVMPYTTHFFFATHRSYVPFEFHLYRNTHSGKGQLNISSQHGNIVNEMYRDTVVALLHNTKNTGLFSLVSVQI